MCLENAIAMLALAPWIAIDGPIAESSPLPPSTICDQRYQRRAVGAVYNLPRAHLSDGT